MSPSRPTIGVRTEALSRKPVKIQAVAVEDALSSSWISGRAGATVDCSSA